jgi:hypothetical protein
MSRSATNAFTSSAVFGWSGIAGTLADGRPEALSTNG